MGDLVAQVAAHGDARAAIAHGVMQAAPHPEMGHLVKGIADESHPGMADPDGRDLGEDFAQNSMQPGAADRRIGLGKRHPATEQNARPVRRGAVIEHDPARVGSHPILGHQPVDDAGRQGLRGDHVAADRDHPAAQIGQGTSCKAIISAP